MWVMARLTRADTPVPLFRPGAGTRWGRPLKFTKPGRIPNAVPQTRRPPLGASVKETDPFNGIAPG